MATIARGTKASAGGGTAFVDGTIIEADEMNTDFDTVYNLVNGNLDGDNIVDITESMITAGTITNTSINASAAIAETKIDDISGTAAAHDDTTTPGDSASHTLPTTLAEEVQQLRYVVERLALGIAPDRVDGSGTGTAFWGDIPARGRNLLENPSLAGAGSSVPAQWTDLGTGTPTFSYVARAGAQLTEGAGRELRIQAGSAAVAGISQSQALKASTRYLVVARARITTNDAHLKTTGADAASSFRNIDDTTTSTTYVTLKGVIQTDSTPTNIAVQLTTNGANGDDVRFSFVGLFECNADLTNRGSIPTRWVQDSSTSNVSVDNSPIDLGVSVTTVAPAQGLSDIEIIAEVPVQRDAANGTCQVRLMVDINGGGAVAVKHQEISFSAAGQGGVITMHDEDGVVTPGDVYVITLEGESSAANVATVPGTEVVASAATANEVLLKARFHPRTG